MNFLRMVAISMGALALLGAAGFAQTTSTAPALPPRGMASITIGNSGVAYAAPPVTGAPYSAKEITEHTQTLVDGTHITDKPRTILWYRDSEGRTRMEHPIMMGPNGNDNGATIVEINDSVAGFRYTLDAQNHIAHRVPLKFPGAGGGTAKAGGQGVTQDGPAINVKPPVGVTSSSGGSNPPISIQYSNESLGTQVMDGLTVVGRRITSTIPVGMRGNDQPIVTVTEMWNSPQLKLTVSRKNSDPRNGETTTRLEDLVVGDPDPALFQPPADYTVVDEKGPFTIQFVR